jgi:hypothetical protein
LVVIATKKLVPHISNIESDVIKTGSGNLANKGAIRISFKLASSKLCFIGTHMTSDEGKCEKRNQDLKEILLALVFSKQTKKAYKKLNFDDTVYDCIIFAGDLNYRVYTPLAKVKLMLE